MGYKCKKVVFTMFVEGSVLNVKLAIASCRSGSFYNCTQSQNQRVLIVPRIDKTGSYD